MNSKECLENIKTAPGFMGGNRRYKSVLESRIPFLEDIETIKQDLDRLEKLEKVIKILKENLQLVLKQDIDSLINRKIYAVEIAKYYKLYNGFEVTQEEYESLKEVLEHVKWN